MSLPLWLDPTPALQKFRKVMSVYPVRERSDAEQFKRARLEHDANRRTESRKAKEANPMRRYKSHCKLGHALTMRSSGRQDCPTCCNERSRRCRENAKIAGELGRLTQKRRAADEMAMMREKPHERTARKKLESQRRMRALAKTL